MSTRRIRMKGLGIGHCLWLATLIFLSPWVAAPIALAQVDLDHDTWAKSYFRSAIEERRAVGAVLVVVDSAGPLYVEGFGYGDLEAREPIHPVVTYIPIGDIGNIFTFQQIYLLERDQRLSLDEPINTFLTRVQLDPVYADTTVRDLLQNHSGFTTSPRGSLVRRNAKRTSATQFVRHLGASSRIVGNDVPQYSAYAAAVATIMVEDLTGEPVDERLTRFFESDLGVEPFFNTPGSELPQYILQHYSISKYGDRTRQDLHASAPGFLAAKGVHLTPVDIGKLAVRLLADLNPADSGGLSREPIAETLSYEERNYQALSALAQQAFGISGEVQSATMDLVLIPELDIGVFAMVSGRRKSPDISLANDRNQVAVPLSARKVTNDFIEQLNNSPSSLTNTPSMQALNKFEGVYAGIGLQESSRENIFDIDQKIASVRVDDGHHMTINDLGPFHHVNDTTFVDVNGTVATFHLNLDGQVQALTFANHTVNKMSDPDFLLKYLAGFAIAALAGLALLSAPFWLGRSLKESLAKWIGTLAAVVMIATVALPAWQYYDGWPSSYTEHPFFFVWSILLWTLTGLTALTAVVCAIAWKSRYWAMDGQGVRRRTRFTFGTLGLSGVVYAYAQMGLLSLVI